MGNYLSSESVNECINESVNNGVNEEIISHIYNLETDNYDHRDKQHIFTINEFRLPLYCDLREYFSEPYNQGKLGSCSANAIGGAIQYDCSRQHLHSSNAEFPSRLYIYYNERDLMGTINEDSGSTLRNGMKAINNYGFCSEKMWPYDIEKFENKPSDECYKEGEQDAGVEYKRVNQHIDDLRHCLSQEHLPIVFGFVVYESMETPQVTKTGFVPTPEKGEKMLGGHAILLVGYDDVRKVFFFRNSWDENWGDHGCGYIPYKYVLNPKLAFDFWTVKKIK